MKKKILLIPLILAGAALIVLSIAGANYILTPKPPTPPPADTPSVQEFSPESAETLAAATQTLAGVQPPQASTAAGEIMPYTRG